MNNHEGAILVFPLELPYKLELVQGKITISATSLLTLKPGCSIVVDSSAANTSYIDGPMRKEGLSAAPFFLFPVGKNPVLRWLELKKATGNFTVEYIRKNPRLLANGYGTGIDHISSLEYWAVIADPDPLAAANIELSFLDPGSGGVTDLATLRVAQLSNSTWTDGGQDGTSGSFGAAGSVVSTFQDELIGERYFALASSVNLENPLPVKLIDFSARLENKEALLRWQIDPGHDADYFEILQADHDEDFRMVGKLDASASQTSYQFVMPVWESGLNYFRLRVHDNTGISYLSRIIQVRPDSDDGDVLSIYPTVVNANATVIFKSKEKNRLSCLLVGMNGRSIKEYAFLLEPGTNSFSLDFSGLSSGIYQLVGRGKDGKYFHARFIKSLRSP
ncbi:MAG TPA: hypothetical protein VK543_16185, partial [Puia sp.]|nr:hypothetical protein [Puia sp.]